MILDQHERIQALDPEKSWIVQAPAGSGKTELLVGRFLAMLARVQEPEEVLAITFTKKAASEMQARILAALRTAQLGIEPKAEHEKINFKLAKAVLIHSQKNHWRLLENTGRLRISTIDSLCAYLTAQLPISAKFGENFEVTDLPNDLYQEAMDQLLLGLKENLPFNSALKRCLFYLDNRLDRFKDLLKSMLAKRAMWLDIILKLNPEAGWEEALKKSLDHVTEEMLGNLEEQWPECLNVPVISDLGLNFHALANILLTDKNTLRKQVDKRQGFLPKSPEKKAMEELLEQLESHPGFIEQLIRIRSLPSQEFTQEFTQEGWALMQDWIEVLKAATAYLQIVFQTRKKVDFTEIALNALQALGDEDSPSDILLRLDYQLSHLLVDEYQDTSQHQYRLLASMVREWQPGDGRTIFLVGDPMQSIYRFRQADVGLFLKTIEDGLGEIKLDFLQLKINFRSTPEIIHWINQVFSEIFPKQKEGLFGAVTYAPSSSPNELSCRGEPESCVRPKGVEIVLEESPENMANSLAEKIVQYQTEFPNHSMAILVRARSHLKNILPALSNRNIAYRGVDIENLKEKSVVLDCLTLTYALYDLKDDLSWMALLRTPVFGFELKDLLAIAQSDDVNNADDAQRIFLEKLEIPELINQLSSHAQNRLKLLLPRIKTALKFKTRESIDVLVFKLWNALGFPEGLNHQEELESAERYFDLLKKLKPAHRLPEREVLENSLESLYAKPLPDSKNPVEIMTVHKSKGLEFDHVFLVMPNQSSRVMEKPLFLWQDWVSPMGEHELLMAPHRGKEKEDSPLYQFLYGLEKEKDQMEFIRLLYVAATRAKSRLSLIGEIELTPEGEIKKPKSGSALSVFWPVIGAGRSGGIYGLDIVSPLAGETGPKRIGVEGQRGGQKEGRGIQRIPMNISMGFDLPEIPDLENFNHPEKPEYGLDEKILGVITHRCLEQITNLNLDLNLDLNFKKLPKEINHWRSKILSECYLNGASDPEKMAQDILKICEKTLQDPQGQWILESHPEAMSELSLWLGHSENIIDRTFIDKNSGARVIIDYKLSQPGSGESMGYFLEREKEKYRDQLERYGKLIKLKESQAREIQLYLYFPRISQLLKFL